MKTAHHKQLPVKRLSAAALCLILAMVFVLPFVAHAEQSGKTVRVGWYESPFNITDQHGRRSGYAYEYQRKIAAYTGWTYEYVDGTWPELLQMLMDGEIDLMSDVSYTPERAQQMLYTDLPMGSEEYYLFITKSNTEITAEDLSTLNGKKVGAYKGSVQIGLFQEWEKAHGVNAEIVELTASVEECLQMLQDGEIDVYLALDSFGDPIHNTAIALVGSSYFYFAVRQDRKDLLSELNGAMTRIQTEDRRFNEEMAEKYTVTTSANLGLTQKEETWLDSHGPIRVGYQDDYMAFCAADENGELTGALKDYLSLAAQCLVDRTLEFETVAYPTKAAVIEALEKGEVDCMFPANLTDSDAENMKAIITPPVTTTEVYAVVREPEQQSFVIKQDLKAAVDQNNTIFDMFLSDHFPSELFRQWAQLHNVRAELVELTSTEEESLQMLGSRLDAFVTMDVNANPKTAVPVWKIGSSDYYFAVSSQRSDLLAPLNAAMSRIQDENINFSQQLSEQYFKSSESNLFLSAEELTWLTEHGTIRVGYQDHYLAFCAKDEATGELTGTLKDYLDSASDALENAHLDFEAIAYPTASDALKALQNGEIDCMFPANLIASDAESMDAVMTPALMKTETDAVVRKADQKEFIHRDEVTVAVNQGNTNYEMFLKDHFPGWKIKYYPDTPTGLKAIAAGEADCVIISNYRFNNIAKQCEKLNLASVYTGVDMSYYLAVRRGDTQLYSILAKTTAIVPGSTIHAALTYYSTEEAKTSFIDNIKDNLTAVLLGIAVIVLLILFLLLRSIQAERKAIEEERIITDLNRQVFVDALTHVRNKGGYDNYIRTLQARLDQGEALEVAIGVFDCDNLKQINDQYGHDKGNLYLKAACSLICRTFQHSPVFRMGGDEFVVILLNQDYQNRQELTSQFERAQKELDSSATALWEQVHVAMGITEYDPVIDDTIADTVRRADKIMYENKRNRKKARQNAI